MSTSLFAVTFDCADAPALARFWAGVLGRQVAEDSTSEHVILLAGDGDNSRPRITFNTVPEPKTVKNRVHLDPISDTFDAATERAAYVLRAGAVDHRGDQHGLRRRPLYRLVHICYGHEEGQPGILDLKANRLFPWAFDLNCDQIHFQMASHDFAEVDDLRGWPKDKDLSVGVTDIEDLRVETPEKVAEWLRRPLRWYRRSRCACPPGARSLPCAGWWPRRSSRHGPRARRSYGTS